MQTLLKFQSVSLIVLLQESLPWMHADGSRNPFHMRHMSRLCHGSLTTGASTLCMETTSHRTAVERIVTDT